MRILITNITLAARSGTEIVASEVARELVVRGHAVAIYAGDLGPLADRLRLLGVIVTDKITDLRSFDPDIIHAHHSSTYAIAQSAFPSTPCIWLCHDVTAWHDEPPDVPQIALHVAHSTTTFNRLVYQGGVDPSKVRMLPNSADVPPAFRGNAPKELRTALIVAKYNDHHVAALEAACSATGIQARVIGGGRGKLSSNILDDYLNSDVVFGSDKVAIEAIAAGRPVICVDERGAAGLVTSDVFLNWRARNFGGPILRHPVETDFISQELRNYDPDDFTSILEQYRTDLMLEIYMTRLELIYQEALSIEKTYSLERTRIPMAAYLEKILPLGRGRGSTARPEALAQSRAASVKFRTELESTKLSQFSFADKQPLTFAEGDAGRATLRGGWDLGSPTLPVTNSPEAFLALPDHTAWQRGSIIKIEGFVIGSSLPNTKLMKNIKLAANGAVKHEKNIETTEEMNYTYCFFKIEENLITQSENGRILLSLLIEPYTPDNTLGRGFAISKIWNH